jgi:hypothetical protein
LSQSFDVDVLRPFRQQVLRRLEIHRRHHRNQVGDVLRLECGIAQAHCPALAHAQQIERVDCILFEDEFDASSEITADVLAQGNESVRAVRIPPVEEIDVDSQRQKFTDEGSVRLQIQHVRPIDHGVANEQWRYPRGPGKGGITVQLNLVFGVYTGLLGQADLHLADFAQRAHGRPPPLLHGCGILHQSGKRVGCRHRSAR